MRNSNGSEQWAPLPEPDSLAQQHSQKLHTLIEQRIAAAEMSFAHYMQLALYEPALGYYMAGTHKFGAKGDFITAPEVSDLFGQCLAVQVRQVLEEVGGDILELGAGSGRLAISVLRALADWPDLRYFILEPSAELQQRQQQAITQALGESMLSQVVWLDTLPSHFVGVCLANEVADALPVERFKLHDNHVMQAMVGCENGTFGYQFRAAESTLADRVQAIQEDIGDALPHGYQSEVCLLLNPWLNSIAQSLQQGVLLLSDYGYVRREYYLPERVMGTLSCFYQHRTLSNPFRYPGLQDITAHVDFTAVIEAGSESGFELLGYTTQSAFLLSCGLTQLAEPLLAACRSELESIELTKSIKTLSLPGEMGERFQFMALGKGVDSELLGFSQVDLSHRL